MTKCFFKKPEEKNYALKLSNRQIDNKQNRCILKQKKREKTKSAKNMLSRISEIGPDILLYNEYKLI